MVRWETKEDWEAEGSPRINPQHATKYSPDLVGVAEKLVAAGATLKDLAFYFGTTRDNIQKWKREYPEFKRATNSGKKLTKAYLIGKGIRAAAGYVTVDKKIVTKQKVLEDGSLELIPGTEVTVEETHKTIPSNDRLLMFLVSCLDRQEGGDDWVSKQYIEKKVETTHTHKLDAASVAEQIDRLAGGYAKVIEAEIIDMETVDAIDSVLSENNGEPRSAGQLVSGEQGQELDEAEGASQLPVEQ